MKKVNFKVFIKCFELYIYINISLYYDLTCVKPHPLLTSHNKTDVAHETPPF